MLTHFWGSCKNRNCHFGVVVTTFTSVKVNKKQGLEISIMDGHGLFDVMGREAEMIGCIEGIEKVLRIPKR